MELIILFFILVIFSSENRKPLLALAVNNLINPDNDVEFIPITRMMEQGTISKVKNVEISLLIICNYRTIGHISIYALVPGKVGIQ